MPATAVAGAAVFGGCDLVEIKAVAEPEKTDEQSLQGEEASLSERAEQCKALERPACKVAMFDAVTGVCAAENVSDGVACDDGMVETAEDQCSAGQCAGELIDCRISTLNDQCNEAVLDEDGLGCVREALPTGTPCDDGLHSTTDDECWLGECNGDAPNCNQWNVPGSCQVNVFEPEIDGCKRVPKPDGSACSGSCFTGQSCQQGVCTGGEPGDCSSFDSECEIFSCGASGSCEPSYLPAGATPVETLAILDVGECAVPACDGAGNVVHQPLPAGTIVSADVCGEQVCDGLSSTPQQILFGPQVACTRSFWNPSDDCAVMTGHCTGASSWSCKRDAAPEGTACKGGQSECTTGYCGADGSCVGSPVAEGTPCASQDRQCSTGACSEAGECVALPINEGTACEAVCAATAICVNAECHADSVALLCDPTQLLTGNRVLNAKGELFALFDGPEKVSPIDSGVAWVGLALDMTRTSGSGCGWDAVGNLGCIQWNAGTQLWVTSLLSLPVGWTTQRVVGASKAGVAVVATDGTLWVVGPNSGGRFGTGALTVDQSYAVLTQVGSDSDWQEVAVADDVSCGIRKNGTLWCVGNWGKHGIEKGPCVATVEWQQVGSDTWAHVWTGYDRFFGAQSDGKLFEWRDFEWSCADPLFDPVMAASLPGPSMTVPKFVGDLIAPQAISVVLNHQCLLDGNGAIWCWGSSQDGASGSLGLPLATDGQDVALRQISATDYWVAIGGSYNLINIGTIYDGGRTFAMKSDGSLWAWGGGDFGGPSTVPGKLSIAELNAIPKRIW